MVTITSLIHCNQVGTQALTLMRSYILSCGEILKYILNILFEPYFKTYSTRVNICLTGFLNTFPIIFLPVFHPRLRCVSVLHKENAVHANELTEHCNVYSVSHVSSRLASYGTCHQALPKSLSRPHVLS